MRKKMLIIGAVLVLLAAVALFGCGLPAADNPALSPSVEQTETEAIPSVPAAPQLSLVAVGDDLIHGPIYRGAQRAAAGKGFDFSAVYQQVAPLIEQADFAAINQETPLGGTALGLSSYPRFNSPQELGDYLISIGFDLFSQANNHVLDCGGAGVQAMLAYWAAHPEVVMAGLYADQTAARKIAIQEKEGVKLAFLAYTYGTNGLSITDSEGYVNYIKQEAMAADIAQAEELADVTVVSLHWGNEYDEQPTAQQVALAQFLAEQDVDIVLGSHSHTLQPVEMLPQPDGGAMLVAYSLGNFVSSQNSALTMLGGMLRVDFCVPQDTRQVEFDKIKLVPLVTQYTGKFNDTQIIPWSLYSRELAGKHGIRQYDAAFSYEYLEKYLQKTIAPNYL